MSASADPHANCKACGRCNGCITCGNCTCPPPRFFALGHRIPIEAGLLAFWKTRNQRAALVALLAHRTGRITAEGLLVRLFGIAVYGQAQDVLAEGAELVREQEERDRARRAGR